MEGCLYFLQDPCLTASLMARINRGDEVPRKVGRAWEGTDWTRWFEVA
jgi:hypothetical protein